MSAKFRRSDRRKLLCCLLVTATLALCATRVLLMPQFQELLASNISFYDDDVDIAQLKSLVSLSDAETEDISFSETMFPNNNDNDGDIPRLACFPLYALISRRLTLL